MNKKLKYSVTLIILTSIFTHQNIDAAYLYQRAKDMYNYRFPSLVGSAALAGTALGTHAYTGQDHQWKILAALLASGLLLRRACNVADTSTFEGLMAEKTGFLSSYSQHQSSNNPGNAKVALIQDLRSAADENDVLLNKKINDLEKALDILFKKTEPVINLKEGSYGLNFSLGRFTKMGENTADIEKEKQTKLYILDQFFKDPSKIQEKIDTALAQEQLSSQGSSSRKNRGTRRE